MAAKSTTDHYGSVAVTIHWLSVLLIVALMGTGLRAEDMVDSVAKAAVLRIHVPLGIAVLLLTLARIAWWWFAGRKPVPVAGMAKWQAYSARVVHVLFYVVILGMTASGIGMLVTSGAGAMLFAGAEGQLPDFWDFKPRVPHGIGARIMIALFVFHGAAALYHQFVLRDGLLKRMWYRRASR